MDRNFEHLDAILWLLIYGIQHNDKKSTLRAGELLDEASLNRVEILYLCTRCYMAAMEKAEEMVWYELERTGKATRPVTPPKG